ncbi:MAG: VIT domain-containing protein [Crocinitomicaceae bacterium]
MKLPILTSPKIRFRFVLILLGILSFCLLLFFLLPSLEHPNKKAPYADLFDRTGSSLIEEKSLLANKSVPVLKISNERERTIHLSSLNITSTIENGVARTRYDMHFYNHEDRDLEAELQFPLSDGQTISYFAMDVDGEMRPGVAVEKVKARVAYEATVRQGIDPGLVEKTIGNNFKLRVFPVPSKGTKHIIVEYMHELTMDVKHAYYYLPLYFKEKIPHFQYAISIIGQKNKPNMMRACSEDFQLKAQKNGFRSQLKRSNFLANRPILIQLKNENINESAALEVKKYGSYFHTNLHIPQKYARKKMPKTITVLWDVSSSRLLSQLEKEKKLLRSYLAKMKNGKIELIPFGYKVFPAQHFHIKNGNTDDLFKVIDGFQYDGATSLQQFKWHTTIGEEILLFSDGIQNLGDAEWKIPSKELYAIQSSVKSNNASLKLLADQSHGAFIDMMQLSEKESLERLNSKSLHFMGFVKNPNLESYFPSHGFGQYGMLSVSGKMKHPTGKLMAKFGVGNKILLQQTIELKEMEKGMHADFERMWAIHQLNELQENPKENEQHILQTGLTYSLVSDYTSLLVLDRVEDYVQHRILPPKRLRKMYDKLLKEALKSEKETKEKHLTHIKKEWREQKSWWTNYQKVKVAPNQSNLLPPNPGQGIITEENIQGNALISEVPREVQTETHTSISANDQTIQTQAIGTDSISLDLSHGYILSPSALGASTYSWTNQVNASFSNAIAGSYQLSVTDMNATGISSSQPIRGSLRVAAWNPNTPYLKRIKSVHIKDAYQVYLKEREKYASQPSFYLDVSDYLIYKKRYAEGIRVLTNIAELDLENHSLLRIVAQRLLQLEEKELALSLFKHLIDLRPDEPQSYRDLGLAYEKLGNYSEALHYLYRGVTEPYDGRFDGIQCIALNEINNIIAQHPLNLNHDFIDPAFIKSLPVDIRIVLNWDTDDTDVDLWVTEPDGEKCMYSYPLTNNGGRISNDFTQGYGPEEYMIRHAQHGTYHIEAHYYGDHRPSVNGKATLSVQLFKQYGTRKQYKREITRRLNVTDDVVDLGEFEF